VVKTTVDHNRLRGTEVAFAASIIEILQALIAISFGMVISSYLESNIAIKIILALVFIVLAVFIYIRESKPVFSAIDIQQGSFFKKGLLIATLNPQAVPFWIFALATISQYFDFEYVGVYLACFLLGVFAGKLIALYGFVIASDYLKSHLQKSSKMVNRLLAGILLLIGLSQASRAVITFTS
jgi:threonine/homoserine/homoserine lactone efflux protein